MPINDLLLYIEQSFEELFALESIIKLTRDTCLNKEERSCYNDLSQERNNYINMLTIALEKVENIKHFNLHLEHEIGYLKQNTNNSCG